MRTCDNCGSRMAPFFPRARSEDGENLLCKTCKGIEDQVVAYLAFLSPEEAWSFMASIRKEAHDSGDGETIFHCPFCGAGGVIGRSDGTAECQFCKTVFTVQIQPSTSAVPQTIEGQPYENSEMPGSRTAPGEVEPGNEPEETEALVDEVSGNPEDVPNPNPLSTEEPKINPFAAHLRPEFKTAQGDLLSEEDYIKHLALTHADDREAVLAALRRG